MVEYERKYLMATEYSPCNANETVDIRQGYLAISASVDVRIRIQVGICTEATLCIKGREEGGARTEFEWSVSLSDAEKLLDMRIGRIIEKTRHSWDGNDGGIWSVDVFRGALEGLVLAEWECDNGDRLNRGPLELPSGILREVTGDSRFRNHYLAYTRDVTVDSLWNL
ncbi:MAG: adenylate cyclase [bacterium]|nr:adenylate cyclase [bacterium]